MATFFARRRFLTTVTAVGVVGAAVYISRPPHQLESAQNAPSKTLSFPSSMIFAKQLKVRDVEQVNHDTKRITFELPGGPEEVSGVPSSCESRQLVSRGWR